MIYKCPNCAAALVYDTKENCLVCKSCDSTFTPEEIDPNCLPTMHMDMHIYSCTACGAEIMVNQTEAATYCVYCGQPVVVFDRVSSELKPDYIIPFKISKEIAEYALRLGIGNKFFVPKELKNFKVEELRGIYVPFWLYDIEYQSRQYYHLEAKRMGGAWVQKCGYVKEMQTMFKDLPINASHALRDEELQLLGGYYLDEMVPFNPGYLSGFYADRYDIDYDADEAIHPALEKVAQLYDEEIFNFLRKKGYQDIGVRYKSPRVSINKISYVMVPVWFLTFRYKEHIYTLFVNGQTGTAAGNLPIKKSRAIWLFLFYTVITLPMYWLFHCGSYLNIFSEKLMLYKLIVIIVTIFTDFMLVKIGLSFGREYVELIKKSLNFSRSSRVRKYVKERQDT